jgi:hypothetical protein
VSMSRDWCSIVLSIVFSPPPRSTTQAGWCLQATLAGPPTTSKPSASSPTTTVFDTLTCLLRTTWCVSVFTQICDFESKSCVPQIPAETVVLFQRIVDYLVDMAEDRSTLMKSCNMVWKLMKLTTRQIEEEAGRYARAKHLGKEYEVSEAALEALQSGTGEKRWGVGTMMKRLVLIGL